MSPVKLATALSWALLATFASTLALGLLVPLYTDEVGSTMQLARPLIEGGREITLFPQCSSAWSAPLAFAWYPAASLYALVFSKLGLLGYRISSLILCSGWLGVAAWGLARTTRSPDARVRRMASFAAPHALGTIPLALVTARQEPIMTLALCAYIGLPLFARTDSRRTWWGRALVTVAFVLVTSVFTYAHPKALLFAPVVVTSALLTFPRRRPAGLLVAMLFTIAALGAGYGRARRIADCHEAPKVQAVLQALALDPKLAVRHPAAFVRDAMTDLQSNVHYIAEKMAFEPERPWLPMDTSREAPRSVKRVDRAVRAGLEAFVFAAPLVVVAVFFASLRRRRAARAPVALAAALVTTVVAHLALTKNWGFYSSPFVVSALALALALAASVAPRLVPARVRVRARPAMLIALVVVEVVAIASLVTTLVHVGPRLVELARGGGTVVPGQPASVRPFGYSAEREKIRAHAASCGIHGDGAKRLVIDDATLFAFDDLREPVHLIYVSDATLWGVDFPGNLDPMFLRSLGAPGIISRCAYFPTRLVSKAKKADDYCCVGAEDLDLPRLERGQRIDFAATGNADAVVLDGWSWPEEKGRWGTGDASRVVVAYRGGEPATIALEVSAPLGGARHAQDVDVVLNGFPVGTLHLDRADNDVNVVRRLPIPEEARFTNADVLIELRPHDSRPPRVIGANGDERPLGVWVHAIWFE